MNAVRVLVNGKSVDVDVLERQRSEVTFRIADRTYRVQLENRVEAAAAADKRRQPARPDSALKKPGAADTAGGAPGAVLAPMPGVVVEVVVKPGQKVQQGDVLVRIEAMKMQNNIFAPVSGTVSAVAVTAGQEVRDGEILVELSE